MTAASSEKLPRPLVAKAFLLFWALLSSGCILCNDEFLLVDENVQFGASPGAEFIVYIDGKELVCDCFEYDLIVLLAQFWSDGEDGPNPPTGGGGPGGEPGFLSVESASPSQFAAGTGLFTQSTAFDGSVRDSRTVRNGLSGQHAVVEPLSSSRLRQPGAETPGRRAFFTDSKRGLVAVVSLTDGEVLQAIRVGRTPLGLAFSPDGSRLFVANQGSGDVSVIDVPTLAVVGRIQVDGGAPRDVAVTPNGEQVLVAADAGNSGGLFFFDAASMQLTGERRVGSGPTRLEVSPDGLTAYVLSTRAGRISIVDIFSQRSAGAIAFDEPMGLFVSPEGATLFVAGGGLQGRIVAYDTASLTSSREWTLGDTPLRINPAPGGGRLLITHQNSEFISLVDYRDARQDAINIPAPAGLGPAVVRLSN